MKKINLTISQLRNKNVLVIRFAYNNEIKEHLKKLKNVVWSQTLRSFYS
ncbi:hypothetical protein [Polaribacter sp. AHE13PA]|jgi:hypothetical protein|nr:hypothetical protein [Polaribacter sp. AHE13PA]